MLRIEWEGRNGNIDFESASRHLNKNKERAESVALGIIKWVTKKSEAIKKLLGRWSSQRERVIKRLNSYLRGPENKALEQSFLVKTNKQTRKKKKNFVTCFGEWWVCWSCLIFCNSKNDRCNLSCLFVTFGLNFSSVYVICVWMCIYIYFSIRCCYLQKYNCALLWCALIK